MNSQDAKELLASIDMDDRIVGARFFEENALSSDLGYLRYALGKEPVSWVRRSLKSAILVAENLSPSQPLDEPDDLAGLDADQIFAKASEEVASSLIHEFSPIIGLLKVAAAKDIGAAFDASRTKGGLDQLVRLLTAIRDLKRAATVPTMEVIVIGDFIADIVSNTLGSSGVEVSLVGSQRNDLVGDKGLLTLALTNGLRNANEALGLAPSEDPRIIVTWGSTALQNYIVVKDNGPGFQSDPRFALKIGSTSKRGHQGFGLALAKQAVLSMRGEIILRNDADGAHFELRWPRENENTIR